MAGKKLECFTTKEKRVVCKDAKSKEGQQIKAHKKSKKSEVLAKGAVRRVGSKSKIFIMDSYVPKSGFKYWKNNFGSNYDWRTADD